MMVTHSRQDAFLLLMVTSSDHLIFISYRKNPLGLKQIQVKPSKIA